MTTKTIVRDGCDRRLAGCGTTPTRGRLREFAGFARQGAGRQPGDADEPEHAAVTGVDPDYANNVVTEMRKDVSKPEEVRKPIEMEMFSREGGW